MRLLHTSDWHLGQALREWDRAEEHDAFLRWLEDRVEEHAADALLIAGDVFDHANPPASAQAAWFNFLARVARRRPGLAVVVIAGNHDSPARLEAPSALLAGLGVHVVGSLPMLGGEVDLGRVVVPVGPPSRRVKVLAVPFLRPFDLRPRPGESPDAALVRLYTETVGRVRSQGDEPLVVMGHLYAAHGEPSELSERRILGGDLHAVSAAAFPEDVAYVALGHLHLAQRVAGRERVRYAGSPLPLSTAEGHYRHQVLRVDIDGPAAATVTPLFVPRTVPFLRVPERGALPVEAALEALAALPAAEGPESRWPFVELHVVLTQPEPGLPRRIDAALAGRGVRLTRVVRARGGDGAPLVAAPREALQELDPVGVFEQLHQREHGAPAAPALRRAFEELLATTVGADP